MIFILVKAGIFVTYVQNQIAGLIKNKGTTENRGKVMEKKHHLSRAGSIRDTHNFTIIELMTVISIILILAGILIPSLMRSKRSAQSASCKNNLKQLALTNFMYASTWGHCVAWGADKNSTNLQRWYGCREAVNNNSPYNIKKSPLYQYLKGKNIIKCPEFAIQLNPDTPSPENGSNGYGYNFYVGTLAYFVSNPATDAYYKTGISINDFHDPSKTVMFSDAAMNVNSFGDTELNINQGTLASCSITYAPFDVINKETDTNIENDPSIHFLHERRANISWSDGHVDSEQLDWTINSGWKNKNLGFFGSSSDNSLFNPKF